MSRSFPTGDKQFNKSEFIEEKQMEFHQSLEAMGLDNDLIVEISGSLYPILNEAITRAVESLKYGHKNTATNVELLTELNKKIDKLLK